MRTDAIKLSQKQQATLRRRAVQLRKQGRSNAEVALILSVHEKTVSGWWTAYGRIGPALFEPGKRGRRRGDQRKLSATREREIQRLITEKLPDRLNLPSALWTRPAVGELIERRYGIRLPVRTLAEYLRRWGYKPPRPQTRAQERGDTAMKTWLAESYPGIVRRAKRDGTRVLWGDQTIVLRATSESGVRSMMRAVSNRGVVHFLIYAGALKVGVLVPFCARLIVSTEGRTVHLILDYLPVHGTKAFLRWMNDHRQQFTVSFLPTPRGGAPIT